jgi:hypothetical protein
MRGEPCSEACFPYEKVITERSWLAAVVADVQPIRPFWHAESPVDLTVLAELEGISALVDVRLRTAVKANESWALSVPLLVRQAFEGASRNAALFSMLLEVETRRLLALMAHAGLSGLLLKGQALAQWAYVEPHLRASGDVDVLLASSKDAELLASQLLEAGYELSHQMPAELVGYELTCVRKVSDAVSIEIDLHWRLSNSPLFGYRFTFDELMNESIPLPGLGSNARGLGPVHALIHACMHRAFNLSEPGYYDSLKWLYDIPVLTRGFAVSDWEHFTSLCRARGLAGVCLVSLDAASETFGAEFLALPPEVRIALEQARATESLDVSRLRQWRYREFKVMMALPTVRMRLRYLGQRFLPSRDYMAQLYDAPDAGYLGLLGIRLRRALKRFLGRRV